MCRIMVNQTMALSGGQKPANQGYVKLTHNFKVVLGFISKICNKIIYRKLNLVSKLQGLIWRKNYLIDQKFGFSCSTTKILGRK